MLGSYANASDAQLPRKRKRPTVSCSECHRRKQKCDRQQPCFHCTRRGKTEICLYEHTAEEYMSYESITTELGTIENASISQIPSDTRPGSEAVIDQLMSRQLGYSSSCSTGTFKIVSQLGEPDRNPATFANSRRNNDAAAQYLGLIREIPHRKYVNILVHSFFTNVAWHYDVIEEAIFRDELSDWDQVSYTALKQGPEYLPVNTRYFPALLLQVLALALLYQPVQYDDILDDLKYAPDIDFSDLASDYSTAGHRIMCMLGSRDMPLSKIQAGLMKACFEKSIGSVIESWHTLGSTIRDAQELGLHQLSPYDANKVASDASKPREVKLRRKLWLVLHLWDAHMAVVLGRPMATRLDPRVQDRSRNGPEDTQRRREQHLPASSMGYLPPPPTLDCKYPWLPAARETLITEVYFVLLALHRPFMSSISTSRVEALKAALQMLESQNRLFSQAGSHMHIDIPWLSERQPGAPTSIDEMHAMGLGEAGCNEIAKHYGRPGLRCGTGPVSESVELYLPSRPPALYMDGSRNLNRLAQASSGDYPGQEILHITGAMANNKQDLDNPLRQEQLFDLVYQDLLGKSQALKQTDTTVLRQEQCGEPAHDSFWQLMDDLT
ncbi:hypothetical protein ACCO45_004872 [Purpureocillium lilacinum]|uniref:Uncharacterized protein n=1 Tax=Purpureocillium lilacinum TaxID=33203 RepID=A0ACC4DTS3_PURLI